MEDAGKLLVDCHKEIEQRIKPGVSTREIDTFVETYLKKHGATPEKKDTWDISTLPVPA